MKILPSKSETRLEMFGAKRKEEGNMAARPRGMVGRPQEGASVYLKLSANQTCRLGKMH